MYAVNSDVLCLHQPPNSCGTASPRVLSLVHYLSSVPAERETHELVQTTDARVCDLHHSLRDGLSGTDSLAESGILGLLAAEAFAITTQPPRCLTHVMLLKHWKL